MNSHDEWSGRKTYATQKREAAIRKYEEAVALYAHTDMTTAEIARQCQVTAGGLRAHLRRCFRGLVLARHGMEAEGRNPAEVKFGPARGQRFATREKYRQAVEACKDPERIRLSVSAIAREFGLSATGLGNQLRMHYPDVRRWRDRQRQALGLTTDIGRRVADRCRAAYAPAVELYRSGGVTMKEAALRCGVSPSGLEEHLRFNHRDLLERKEKERKLAEASMRQGRMSGNGGKRGPKPATVEKYRKAVELYGKTDWDVKTVAARTGVTPGGLSYHLKTWHRDLLIERRGGAWDKDDDWIDLNRCKRYSKAAANKYAAAIARLKAGGHTAASVASEWGFNAETFRDYLHQHEPQLAARLGMTRDQNGRCTSRRAAEKYAEALSLYTTEGGSLKAIAVKLGLNYPSLNGYVRRHRPEE